MDSIMDPVRALRLSPRWARLTAAFVLVAGVALAAYFILIKSPGDTSNPGVQFLNRPQATPQDTFVWPTYGFNATRTRYLDAGLSPPFRQVWQYQGQSLLEFQPVLANGTLY